MNNVKRSEDYKLGIIGNTMILILKRCKRSYIQVAVIR